MVELNGTLYLGYMRNSQEEADAAHDQGQQLLSLQEAQNLGTKLVFYEGYCHLNCGKLRHTENTRCFLEE